MQADSWALPAGLRLLLVEDVALIAFDGRATLQALGVADVVWARDEAEALGAIETGGFDAALLDLCLGKVSSAPLARRLAALGIPFGFLTGYSDRDVPAEFRGRPLVTKPFTTASLAALLRKLLDA